MRLNRIIFTAFFIACFILPASAESLKIGAVYSSEKTDTSIRMVSANELDFRINKIIYAGDYTIDGKMVRVVFLISGTKQIRYFEISDKGLTDSTTKNIFRQDSAQNFFSTVSPKTILLALKTALEMYAADTGNYNNTGTAIIDAEGLKTMLEKADLWPTNFSTGTASGNLGDAFIAANGDSGYRLLAVGKDVTHTFIYDNSTNSIIEHNSLELP